MTPETLEKLIAIGDVRGVAEATESLTESERGKLSRTAGNLFKALEQTADFGIFNLRENHKATLEHLDSHLNGKETPGYQRQRFVSMIAVLALCPFSTARHVNVHSSGDEETEAAFKVLSDRKPEWLAKWVDEKLNQRLVGIRWRLVRKLTQDGICAKPSGDGYILLMVRDFPSRVWEKDTFVPLSDKLLEDRGLLDDEIWELFRVDTKAFSMDWDENAIGTSERFESWGTALRKLAASGDIDRQRLLNAYLDGLFTGFKNDVLSGFIRLYERLEPTPQERAARQQSCLDLLSSSAAHVVTFALNALKIMAKHGLLDDNAFLASVGPALASRTKGHPKTAMAILEGIVKGNGEMRRAAAVALLQALVHESPDVQQRAVDLLEKWTEPGHALLAEPLGERMDDVAASQRPRVEALLQRLGGAAPAKTVEASQKTESRGELLRRADALPPKIRRVSGVDDAVTGLDQSAVPPLRFMMLDAAVLTGVAPIEPISDVEELIDTVAHAVEKVDSADEVERILDGISRLCDQRPANFERRTEPLVKRIDDLVRSRGVQGIQGLVATGVPFGMRQLATAWLRPKLFVAERQPRWTIRYYPEQFLDARLLEIAGRVAQRRPWPLLATPTHTHGWLDPITLVKRIESIGNPNIGEYRYDLLQAMLRLAPDGRAEALAASASIKGDIGRILRWALGGTDAPVRTDMPNVAFWLAAGRARAPQQRLNEFATWGIDDPGPDGIEPAQYAWQSVPDENTMGRKVPGTKSVISRTPPPKALSSPADWPTAALHGGDYPFFPGACNTGWFIDWMSTLWPQNADSFFAAGVQALALRIDANASTLSPNCVFLRPLLQDDRPWSEMARLLALLGLAGRDADARGHATDAFVEAFADSRAHPDELACTLAHLTQNPCVKVSRIVEGLREVARVSDLHGWVISQLFASWLKTQTALPHDAHHVLEPLLELLTRYAIPLDEEARKPLTNLQGSSKTAKLAKRLLDFTPQQQGQRQQEFMLELLKARIERAERWQRGAV